jgi:hypothetical protein
VKGIQTLLGDLHDLQVLAAQIADAVGDAAAERARRLHDLTLSGATRRQPATRKRPRAATTGMLALARLVRQTQDELFRRFAAEWQSGARVDLWGEVAIVATALASRPAPLPERRGQSRPPPRAARPAVT